MREGVQREAGDETGAGGSGLSGTGCIFNARDTEKAAISERTSGQPSEC